MLLPGQAVATAKTSCPVRGSCPLAGQWLHSEVGKPNSHYWTQQLHDPLSILELPTDRQRTEELSLHAARQPFQLPKELTVALTRLSHQESTTVFMTLAAAFKMLLYSYTGQKTYALAPSLPTGSLRNRGTDWPFCQSGDPAHAPGRESHLAPGTQRVRNTTLDAYAHQELPFEYLAVYSTRASV